MDKKPVTVLSTGIDTTSTTVKRCVDKTGERCTYHCHLPVAEYNSNMGYVDQADALRGSYEMGRRSNRWWTYIFWYVVNTASVIAFVLYNLARKQSGEAPVKHLSFMKSLRHTLLEPAREAVASKLLVCPSPSASPVVFPECSLDRNAGCKLTNHKHSQKCVSCDREGRVGKTGKPKRTTFRCSPCMQFLCNNPCCFYEAHKYFNSFRLYDT